MTRCSRSYLIYKNSWISARNHSLGTPCSLLCSCTFSFTHRLFFWRMGKCFNSFFSVNCLRKVEILDIVVGNYNAKYSTHPLYENDEYTTIQKVKLTAEVTSGEAMFLLHVLRKCNKSESIAWWVGLWRKRHTCPWYWELD